MRTVDELWNTLGYWHAVCTDPKCSEKDLPVYLDVIKDTVRSYVRACRRANKESREY